MLHTTFELPINATTSPEEVGNHMARASEAMLRALSEAASLNDEQQIYLATGLVSAGAQHLLDVGGMEIMRAVLQSLLDGPINEGLAGLGQQESH